MSYAAIEFSKSYHTFVKYFGWKKCAFLYQDAAGVPEIYGHFINNASDGIKVYDIPEYNGWTIQANYDTFSEGYVSELLDHIFKSEIRILLAISPIGGSSYFLLEYLYDQGYRSGDFILIGSLSIAKLNNMKEADPERYRKVVEFANYSLLFSQPVFVGEVGEEFI